MAELRDSPKIPTIAIICFIQNLPVKVHLTIGKADLPSGGN
jgi:hypothetical protein